MSPTTSNRIPTVDTSSTTQRSRSNNDVEVTLEDYLPTPTVPSASAALKEEQFELGSPQAKSEIRETEDAPPLSQLDITSTSGGSSQHDEDQVVPDPLESSSTVHGYETSSVKSGETIEDAGYLSASSTGA
jgi:hypothetical protein